MIESKVPKMQLKIGNLDLDSDGEENELGMFGVKLESDWSVGENNYKEIVAAMQDLYGQFCSRIASSILELENS